MDSATNLNNSAVIIPDGMLAKEAGSNLFKLGNGKQTWSQLSVFQQIGPTGPQGKQGIQGPTGPAGVNATTTALATTSSNGLMSAADKKTAIGLATYDNTKLDPNTALNRIMLVAGSTAGLNDESFVFITQSFYSGVSETSNRCQLAQGYNTTNLYTRYYSSGKWSAWRKVGGVTSGGGLKVDSAGNLSVDFSTMPTDKFEALLKSIWVPIKLTASKTFYVNSSTGSDTLSTGRGESTSAPFKTIQACLTYVCTNYSFGPYNITINLGSNAYTVNSEVKIPEFQSTSGQLIISGNSVSSYTTITLNNTARLAISAGSRTVTLRYIAIKHVFKFDGTWNPSSYFYAGTISISSGSVILIRFSITVSSSGSSAFPSNLGSYTAIGVFGLLASLNTYGGTLSISLPNFISANKQVVCISSSGSASIIFSSSGSSQEEVTWNCSGTCTCFCSTGSSGKVEVNTARTYKAIFSGSMTGKRYACESGGSINTNGRGASYFPGTTAGTVNSATYSWYK